MENMLIFEGPDGQHEARTSLATPDPPPPPPLRPAAEIATERRLQGQYTTHLRETILPAAEKARDRLAEARGAVEQKRVALLQRIAAAQTAEQERQRQAGMAIQRAWLVPTGSQLAFPLTAIDRMMLEVRGLEERELQEAINLVQAQEQHLAGLRRQLTLNEQRLGQLDSELAAAQAAEAAPAPDPEAVGGRLYGLRRALTGMGVLAPKEEQ